LDIDEQPRKRIIPATSKEITKISTLCLNLLGHLGLHIGCHAEEVRHDLVALLLAGVLNLLELGFGLLVGIIFGLLKSARVL
jgi:xanthosine utilization system XapX-like protein